MSPKILNVTSRRIVGGLCGEVVFEEKKSKF